MTEVVYEEAPFVSSIVTSPKVKRTPADLLDERQTFMRFISRSIGTTPTIEDLMKHADRFGTDQVVETAAELGYSLVSCTRLADHCDRVETAEFKRLHPHAKPPKVGSAEERCKQLLGITDDAAED